MEKLTCKECDYQSRNLVPHIEEAHADLGLVGYISRHGEFPETMVNQKLMAKIEENTVNYVRISGQKLPWNEIGNEHVPNSNDHYIWNEHIPDVILDINQKLPVFLIGHTGCGKTSSIFELGARTNQGVLRVNMNGQTTIGDFVGLWTVKGGETVWVDGVLPYAMRRGLWLIIDEIDFAEPAILSVLNSILEEYGRLTLKEKGHEIVEPHENFRLFATANSVGCMGDYRGLYQGTNILNEAFLDRWQVYHFDYLKLEDEVNILTAVIPKMTPKIAMPIVEIANECREGFKNEILSCTFSTRRLIDWGRKMMRHGTAMKGAESTIFSKVSKEDAETIKGIIFRKLDEVGANK